jgi:quercetin dioxygenase-like cupin family protein
MEQLEIVEIGASAETREFSFGRFELYRIGGREIGRAVYTPGWRWSEHVRPIAGTDLCEIDHLGFVVSGSAGVRMADGTEAVLKAGDFFAIPPGHDSWVIGEEEYVSLHLLGAEAYARG